MEIRNRNEILWGDLTKEERALEKKEFIESYIVECGITAMEAALQWEGWLNAEGWTGRDEEIAVRQDRRHEHPQFGSYDMELEAEFIRR